MPPPGPPGWLTSSVSQTRTAQPAPCSYSSRTPLLPQRVHLVRTVLYETALVLKSPTPALFLASYTCVCIPLALAGYAEMGDGLAGSSSELVPDHPTSQVSASNSVLSPRRQPGTIPQPSPGGSVLLRGDLSPPPPVCSNARDSDQAGRFLPREVPRGVQAAEPSPRCSRHMMATTSVHSENPLQARPPARPLAFSYKGRCFSFREMTSSLTEQ